MYLIVMVAIQGDINNDKIEHGTFTRSGGKRSGTIRKGSGACVRHGRKVYNHRSSKREKTRFDVRCQRIITAMPDNKDAPYSKELWETLFEKYFGDIINKLAKSFPHKHTLEVPYSLIEGGWSDDAVKMFITCPEVALKNANDALHNFILSIKFSAEMQKRWVEESGIKISGFPSIRIRDIRNNHLNTFVSVSGVILRKTDVKFQIIEACFKCARCGHENHVMELGMFMVEPFECENGVCGRKGPFKLINEKCIWADKRKIRLQETFDEIQGGEQNLSVLDAVLLGNVDCPPLGSIVKVSGILRGIQTVLGGQKTLDYYPLLDINNIEAQDKEKTIEPTPEELKIMEEMAKDRNIIELLVASTVPSVLGHEKIKEACLCCQVSPDNFMLPDGRKLRGYSHIMLCGDPGVAKSVMLQAMIGNVPRAQYAAGRSASSKGLTVAVTKDKGEWGEGAWVAEAGMLVLADRAFAVIDELDKFEKEEQRDLNTVLEHQMIPVRKAGINRDFHARVPIVASLNPKYGRFDQYEPIPKQLNVPPDTLSRFDLVFTMFDVPKKDDELTSDHITNLWQKATEVHQTDLQDITEITVKWGKDKYVPDISLDMMRKWIHEAKKIKVRITPECREALNEFFLTIRKSQIGDKDAAIPIAWRTLDGMMRLLICQTRLRHGKETEMRDVDRVKALIQESLKIMIDPATGKLDSDIISTGVSKSQRDRIRVLKEVIRQLQDEMKSAVPLNDIVERAVESGMKEDDVMDMIAKLKSVGELIEASNERYRVV